MKRIILFSLLFLGIFTAKSQLFINEVSYSGSIGPYAIGNKLDGWLQPSDWVEFVNDGTLPLSLNGYYLTNDKTNLFKWKFPTGITLQVKPSASAYYVVRCSGRNMPDKATPTLMHTNFEIEQCRDQWLMLTFGGVIKDSLFIRHTKTNDFRGRYPDATDGIITPGGLAWKLFTGVVPTYSATNNSVAAANVYREYCPIPTFSIVGQPFPDRGGWKLPSDGMIHILNPDTVHFQVNYTMTDCSYTLASIPCIQQDLTIGACIGPPQTYSIDPQGLNPPDPTDPGQTTMIRAIIIPKTIDGNPTYTASYAASYLPSFVETNTYFRGPETVINNGFGVISVCVNPTFTNSAASQSIHVEYFDKYQFYSEGYAQISKPLNETWPNQQRGFDIGLNDWTGYGCELTGNVFNDATFGTSTRTVFPNFGVKSAGIDNFSFPMPIASGFIPAGTHMRDAFVQTYALQNGIKLDGLHYKPVIGMINGCYNGIYEFRELANWEYTKYYYGSKAGKDSVDILEEYAGNIINNGTDTGWVTLPISSTNTTTGTFNYIQYFAPTFNTVSQPFFGQVMKKIDKENFMDFMIYNSFLINADLMGKNDSWWRPVAPKTSSTSSTYITQKWRWFMWEMNNVLNLCVPPSTYNPISNTLTPCMYSSGITNSTIATMTTANAAYTSPGFLEWAFERDAQYHSDYLTRYMDLLNTTLRCDKMIPHFNYFRSILTPEMATHCTNWGVSQSDWDANMDSLKARLTDRCNKIEKFLAQASCNNLKGPYVVSVDVRPPGAGYVDFNTLHLTNFVWSGTYYNDNPTLTTTLQAAPYDSSAFVFDHWEFSYHTPSPNNVKLDSVTINLINNENLVAVFADKRNDVMVPTGFTPNGDGNNDLLIPLGAAARYARNYEFTVWNRWGQQVFRTADALSGWDGRYNGAEAQTGVYAYIIRYKNVLDQDRTVKGNVTLIR